MKTYTQLFTLVLFLAFNFGAKAQTAQEYTDQILAIQAQIINDNIHYITKSLNDHKAHQNEVERKAILVHLNQAIAQVKALPAYKGDNSLREAALEVFNHYKETYQLDIKKADSLEINGKSPYNAMKVYFDLQNRAEEKLVKTGKKFINVQKSFARRHNLVRQTDEMICLFTKLAEVNNYTRQVYLAYMKVDEINRTFFESMKRKQVESMEKNRLAVLATAEEAIATLTKLGNFEGNRQYVDMGMKLTHYLKNSASKEYTELVTISHKKHATQADAMRFNKIVFNYHNQSKALMTEFSVASTQLLHQNVLAEANPLVAKNLQKETQKSLSLVVKPMSNLSAETLSYETNVSTSSMNLPQE
ncbi:MAG: hypothetical protein MUE85_05905 [Microscillaceae bacterium]|nr:hypothetical protein [Microscillaceae bacterium]